MILTAKSLLIIAVHRRPMGARKLTDEFNAMMNSKVEYRKQILLVGVSCC